MNWLLETLSIFFWFIVLLTPLVAIHEMGHLLMSRLVGVKILEYGIGIPPRFRAFYKKGITWSLNYIPLGGFVRTYGDHDALDEASHLYTKNKAEAVEKYKQDRAAELVFSGDLEDFLLENHLEYDDTWKQYVLKAKGKESSLSQEEFTKLSKQLETLMEWELDAKIDSKEAFFNKNWLQQTVILVGGVTFNFLTALLLFFLIYSFFGTIQSPQFRSDSQYPELFKTATTTNDIYTAGIIKDSPAEKLGLKNKAKVFSIAGVNTQEMDSIEDLSAIVREKAGQDIEVTFQNPGEEMQTKTVNLFKIDVGDNKQEYRFGVIQFGPKTTFKAENFGASLRLPFYQVYDSIELNLDYLGKLVSGDRDALKLVSGPIGVGNVGGLIIQETGFIGFIYLLALISIGLGVFNLLPIPALDGGRWLIVTLNKITGKRNKKIETILIYSSFIILIMLSLVIAIKDIRDIITGFYK